MINADFPMPPQQPAVEYYIIQGNYPFWDDTKSLSNQFTVYHFFDII